MRLKAWATAPGHKNCFSLKQGLRTHDVTSAIGRQNEASSGLHSKICLKKERKKGCLENSLRINVLYKGMHIKITFRKKLSNVIFFEEVPNVSGGKPEEGNFIFTFI